MLRTRHLRQSSRIRAGSPALLVVLPLSGATRAAATSSAVAASHSSGQESYAWETLYTGSYSFTGDMMFTNTDPTGTEELSDHAAYSFAIDVIDTFTKMSNHKFSETARVVDQSIGATQIRDKVGIETEAPTTSTSIDCTVVSTCSTLRRSRTGIFGAPSPGKPAALVSWAVPAIADATGQYFFDGSAFDPQRSAVANDAPGVTQHCVDHTIDKRYTVQDGATLLDASTYTTTGVQSGDYPWFHYDKNAAEGWKSHAFPSCGGKELTPTTQFDDLWQADALVPLGELPYEKDFTFTGSVKGAISDPKRVDYNATKGQCSDTVAYATHVSFAQLTCGSPSTGDAVPAPAPHSSTPLPDGATPSETGESYTFKGVSFVETGTRRACSKAGALMLEDGLSIMNGKSDQLAQGQDVQILFPGGPEGGSQATSDQAIDLGVTGQVVSSHAHLAGAPRATPGSTLTLYEGSTKLTPGRAEVVTLHVTPAGKQLLDRRHGPVVVTGIATLTPGFGGSQQSAKGTFTLPARS